MSDLRTRVRSITKSTTSETTDAEIDDFLNESSKLIISAMPKELLWPFATESSAVTDGNGFSFTSGQAADAVLLVRRGARVCNEVPPALEYAMESSSGSMYEPSKLFPKYYKRGAKLFIKPDPASGTDEQGLVYFVYPPIPTGTDDTWVLSALEGALIYYSAGMDFSHLANNEIRNLSSYTKPTFVAPTYPTITALDLSTSNANIDAISGSPTVGALSYTDATAAGVSATTIAEFTGAPSYASPTVGGTTESLTATLTALTGHAIGTDADFRDVSMWMTSVGEMLENEKDVDLARVAIQKFQVYITAYNAALQDAVNEFNDENADFQADIKQNIEQGRITMQEALQNAKQDDSIDATNRAKQLEQDIQNDVMELEKYAKDISKFQQQVNAEVEEWVNNNLKDSVAKYVKDYDNQLQVFRLDIENEKAETDAENAKRNAAAGGYTRQAQDYYKWADEKVTDYVKMNSQTVQADRALAAAGARR
jgi:hypothetical protein